MHQSIPVDEAVFQLGNWNKIPVHVAITRERLEFLQIVQRLALQSMTPFVLVAPTARMYCAEADSVMRMRKATFLPLCDHVGLDEPGRWVAQSSRKDLMSFAVDGDAAVELQENIFRSDGATWTISYAGNTVHLPDTKGFRYITLLLREPGRVWSFEHACCVSWSQLQCEP